MRKSKTVVLSCALLALSLTASTPVIAEDEAVCSLADINNALSSELSCSTAGTVFFGTSISDFVENQCSTITNSDGDDEASGKGHAACVRCATKAALAFRAAKKAGLIPSTANDRLNTGKLKQLCSKTNDGDDDTGDDPPASDALQDMYNQIKLCFPNAAQTVEPAQCTQCAGAVLDNALNAGVINQAKYTVLKQGIQQVCKGQGGGDGNRGPGNGTPTPATPTPGPNDGSGFKNFDLFKNEVQNCLLQFRTPASANPDACVTCVENIPKDGFDPAKLDAAIPYAKNACRGNFG